jgi:hypothetical protein
VRNLECESAAALHAGQEWWPENVIYEDSWNHAREMCLRLSALPNLPPVSGVDYGVLRRLVARRNGEGTREEMLAREGPLFEIHDLLEATVDAGRAFAAAVRAAAPPAPAAGAEEPKSAAPIPAAPMPCCPDGIGMAIHQHFQEQVEKQKGAWFKARALGVKYDRTVRTDWLTAMTGTYLESNGKPGNAREYRKLSFSRNPPQN